MPFGPFSDFQDCVVKNAGKASPEGFCAWLEHEITGAWPGELTHTRGMTPALRDTFLAAFQDRMQHGIGEVAALAQAHAVVTEAGWVSRNGAWVQVAQHAALKSVRNVEIFKAGTWNGDTYSVDDLRRMVSAFTALRGRIDPPLKLGHSSDGFNQALAAKLGVAPEMLTGEKGKGAIALGWVESLRLDGNTLMADFAYVPDGIAALIEQRGYRKISSEIMYDVTEDGVTYSRVLAAVALLGAEIPAVSEIAGLETAAVYTTSREVQLVADTDIDELAPEEVESTIAKLDAAFEATIKHAKGAPTFRSFWSELKAKFKAIASKKQQFGGEGSGNWGHGGRPGEIGGSAPGGGGGGGGASAGGDKSPAPKAKPAAGKAAGKQDAAKAGRAADRAAERANAADAEATKAEATAKSAERLADRQRAAADRAVKAGDPDAADLKAAADDADEIVRDAKAEAGEARKAASEADAEAKKALRAAMGAAKAEKESSYADEVQEDNMDEHMKQIAQMMGMGEDAKPEDVVTAVKALVARAQKAPPAEMAKFTALEAENKTYAARISELEGRVKASERANRVAHYTAAAAKWTHLPGKPEEFAERLVKLEEVSKDEAAKLVAEYDRLDGQAAAAFKVIGKPATGEQKHEFQRRWEKLMSDENISEADAYAKAMKADPTLEKDYRRQNRPYSRAQADLGAS